MIGTAANHVRDNLDFRRGSTVMVGHLKRSRNVGSGASQPHTKLLLSDGCSAQTKAAACLSVNSSLTNIAECYNTYKCSIGQQHADSVC